MLIGSLREKTVCFQCVGVACGPVLKDIELSKSKKTSKYPTMAVKEPVFFTESSKEDEKLTQSILTLYKSKDFSWATLVINS